jgi:serine protease Do
MQRFKLPFWLSAVLGLVWSATVWAAEYPDFATLVEQYSPGGGEYSKPRPT